MRIHSIYDNGGETVDRYVVFFSGRKLIDRLTGNRLCVTLSGNPCCPQGMSQFGTGKPGRHNGRRIEWEELPPRVRVMVESLVS